MPQSIELYFLVNFVMDAALLAIAARANDCLNFRRIFIAAFLAAFYSVAVCTVSPLLGHPLIRISFLIPLGLIVSGELNPQYWFSFVFQLCCACLILGGLGALIPPDRTGKSGWIAAALASGLLLSTLLLNARRQRLTTWEVTVYLVLGSRNVHFRALIDTGNRLREPISGQPVLIAESSLLGELLKDETDSVTFRNVAFGALGGSGMIRCFRPDTVLIRRDNRLIPAPSVWVAIYPGKISGSTHALAPPSFAVIPGNA